MRIVKFLQNEEAATAVEYAVMLAMVLLAVMAAIGAVGNKTGGLWSGIVHRCDEYPTLAR
jgi:pilus assembly protein Flp/PilA